MTRLIQNKTMNLSEYKRHLQSAMTNGINLKSTVINSKGEVVRENEFAPIVLVNTVSFAMLRNGKQSFAEFGKASEWQFADDKAIRNFKDGGKIEFTFDAPDFFN